MLDKLKGIFIMKIPDKYDKEFNIEVCRTNMFRIKIFLLLTILLEIATAVITFTNVFPSDFWMPDYRYLIWRTISLIVMIIEYLYIRKIGKDIDNNYKKIENSLSLFLLLLLVLHSSFSLYELYYTGQGGQSYPILIFMIAIITYFSPKNVMLVFLPAHVLYLISSFLLWTYFRFYPGNVLSNTLTLIAAFILSRVLYLNKYNETVSKIVIKQKNRELEELNQKLEYFSYYDSLTGLYNRRKLQELLDMEWDRCMRHSIPLSILMIDVDYFKEFNDLYGHPTGDECLIQIGALLSKSVRRSSDIIARYGGEEFIIALPHMDLGAAYSFAEGLRTRVEGHRLQWKDHEKEQLITISIGICSVIPSNLYNVEDLIFSADKALYKAKKKRNETAVIEIAKAAERPKLILSDKDIIY